MKRDKFFRSPAGFDSTYDFNASDPNREHVRLYCDDLLRRYQTLQHDSHFFDEIDKHAISRWWEMFLGVLLKENNLNVSGVRHEGPDFRIQTPDLVIWLEATAALPGTGADACAPPDYDNIVSYSDDPILLRLTNSFTEKSKRYSAWIASGLLSDGDACVIAINLGGIHDARWADIGLPLPVRAFFAMDSAISVPIHFDTEEVKSSIPRLVLQEKPPLQKRSGKSVNLSGFLVQENAHISAVITSNRHYVDRPSDGRDFVIVHNPIAKVPVQKGLFPFGSEYWVEGAKLQTR